MTVHKNEHYSFVVVVKAALFFMCTYMVNTLHKNPLFQ